MAKKSLIKAEKKKEKNWEVDGIFNSETENFPRNVKEKPVIHQD